jgi:hypothetical protein
MGARETRRAGFLLGLLAAVLLLVEALIHFAVGVAFLATGRTLGGLGSLGGSVVLVVVALLIGFFAFLGRARGADYAMVAGIVLVVVAIVGWLALGFGGSVLGILAGLFALIAGILFLVSGS